MKQLSEYFSDYQNITVQLLIGYDCPAAIAPIQLKPHVKGEPHIFKTVLGWTAVAHEKANTNPKHFKSHRVAVLESMQIEKDLQTMLATKELKNVQSESVKNINTLIEAARVGALQAEVSTSQIHVESLTEEKGTQEVQVKRERGTVRNRGMRPNLLSSV